MTNSKCAQENQTKDMSQVDYYFNYRKRRGARFNRRWQSLKRTQNTLTVNYCTVES